jgi:GH35 family endo-1,4-beta-xylanase
MDRNKIYSLNQEDEMAIAGSKKKLGRFEAQLLTDYARSKKGMVLSGWTLFWRMSAVEINRKYPELSVDEIIKESRIKTEEESPA